ncbi:MAG: entericidin A/B family lipoprotein [Rickettsiales bacterium]|nr:entericidin A/B family lipoprotein [Rickettsiales bacterium]
MQKSKLPPPSVLTGLLVAALGLTACNTVRGAGEDIQSVGKATERTAEKTGAESDEDEVAPKP